ncbi:hypothetical protein K503DRAFT_852746 [Rhizopogon vinicolor AM-OR11-026]|uniref:Uncharacterized protein n=1 Tax=Rhizopogon vinicolor AM-OR11-026 TaxID=1314800 RepID=A0A1B7NHG3_9AGAM|nr:hypothetical protein K503DRAFT_852746 [Rhizopogon vinicolor AM-OR11-026]
MNVMSSGTEVVGLRSAKSSLKEEKENVQPTRIGPNLAGIPFLNSSPFSPLLQDLLNSLRGISVLFLAKFYCEEDLEKNLVDALDSVTVEQMRKYARRSRVFMNTCQKGLAGKQAAWATKKYHGHRVLPDSILAELEEAEI